MASHQDGPHWLSPEAALSRFQPPPLSTGSDDGAIPRRFGFRIGGVGFLIDPALPSEILESLTTFPVPHTPDWLAGIANLRGNLVPVFDLAKLWQWRRPNNRELLLILGRGESAVGLLVDDPPVILSPSETLTTPPPLPTILRDHIINAYTEEEFLWLDYDHPGLMQAVAGQLGR